MSSTPKPTFSFPNLPTLHSPKPYKPLYPFPKKPLISLSLHTPHSNISQEDPPLSPTNDLDLQDITITPDVEAEAEVNPRRPEEKFVVLNTGVYECRSCGHLYNESAGDPSYPIPPGLGFDELPGDWRCPTCGAAKTFFQSKSIEIAGFAQNQQFGLGGNTLTGGQKTALIFGSLLAFFALFLSGYWLQ